MEITAENRPHGRERTVLRAKALWAAQRGRFSVLELLARWVYPWAVLVLKFCPHGHESPCSKRKPYGLWCEGASASLSHEPDGFTHGRFRSSGGFGVWKNTPTLKQSRNTPIY